MTYDLTRVHQANLKILYEIDRICRKYKIKYMLDAGTLIGAVRHQGFIPWDDDADLSFTRDQYEAFLKVARRELPDGMTLLMPEDLRGGSAFYDFTARITYSNSQMHQDNGEMQFYEGKLNHLWVDLFVLDELPASAGAAKRVRLLHKIIYGMAMGHRYRLDYGKYSPIDKLRVRVLATMGKLVPMKLLFRLQYMTAIKDKKGKSNLYYYSNYQPDYLYVTLRKEWCEETVDMEFEGLSLMAPKGYHQVLTKVYGDYRKLPPEQERVPSHSSMEIQIFDEA